MLVACGMALGLLLGCLILITDSISGACPRHNPCPTAVIEWTRPRGTPLAQEFVQTVQVTSTNTTPLAQGAVWSSLAESMAKLSGFTEEDRQNWRNTVTAHPVVSLVEGCGRMQNRLATLADGTRACVRYRQNTDQIQGELYSYHLSNLLAIHNVPPSVLAEVQPDSEQWSAVREQLTRAGWETGKLVVMTQWIPALHSVHIPEELRNADHTLSCRSLQTASHNHLSSLLQWSDLITLDYLTANMDRFVNSLVNLQWNKDIMSDPAHNLEQSNNRLVFLDNESGLFHGYRLLKKYGHLHENALRRMCLFRKTTLSALRGLPSSSALRLDRLLHRTVRSEEPLAERLPAMSRAGVHTLRQRVTALLNHIKYCETQFS